MGLEATMILVDNSEYSRNGDFGPSRWEAQKDVVNLVSQSKLQQNVESGVGLMTMGNRQPRVLATPSTDHHQLMSSFHGVHQDKFIQLSTSLQIAQLVLKHRINKIQKQQVICFIASPVEETEAKLISLAKKLKKNSIGVHIINIGVYDQAHLDKLNNFIQTINSSDDNSHFLSILPSSISSFTDQVISSPIVNQNINQQGQQVMEDNGLQGIDDPELAMAIKMSLEEEKKKQEKENEKKLQQQQQQEQALQKIQEEEEHGEQTVMKEEEMDLEDNDNEDQSLLDKARLLSLESPPLQQQQQNQENKEVFQDPNFVNELLSQIQGIDSNDKDIKQALDKLQGKDDKDKQDKQDKQDKL